MPDAPRAFGRDAAWLALATNDSEAVAQAMQLRTMLPANWQGGLAAARQSGVFVAPPIDGWVLVTGADLWRRRDLAGEVLPLLQRLSATFQTACWFASHSEQEHHGWALCRRGRVVRAYAFAADEGELLAVGEVTAEERELSCFVADPRDQSDDPIKWWPQRATVHALAARWSRDPDAPASAATGGGWVGRL
jgi:hypothetical protein